MLSDVEPIGAQPTLSVVIPNYNDARYLSEALEAILAQSFRPVEVIVVDDGSTDNSVAVIEEFMRRDPIVRLLRNEGNMGALFSANRGLAHASGDYILFASADDKVLPGVLEKSARLLAQYPQAAVCSGVAVLVDEHDQVLRPHPPRPLISRAACYLPPDCVLRTWRRRGWWFAQGTAVYRRDAVVRAGGFPHELRSAADGFLLQGLALKYGACFIPEPLVMFRVREDAFSSELVSDEICVELMEKSHDLMRSAYGGLFPKGFVDDYARQTRYSKAVCTYQKVNLQRRECFREFERALGSSNWADRVFLSLSQFSAAVERFLGRVYLFARLGHPRWRLLKQKVHPLRKDAIPRDAPSGNCLEKLR